MATWIENTLWTIGALIGALVMVAALSAHVELVNAGARARAVAAPAYHVINHGS